MQFLHWGHTCRFGIAVTVVIQALLYFIVLSDVAAAYPITNDLENDSSVTITLTLMRRLYSRGNVVSFMKNPPYHIPQLTKRLPAEDITEIENMGILKLHSYRFEDVTADSAVIQRGITLLDKSKWGFHSLPFYTKWPDAKGTDIPAIAKAILIPYDIVHEINALIEVGQLVDVGMQVIRKVGDCQHWWLIVKDMSEGGKRKLLAEILDQASQQPSGMTQKRCKRLVKDAIYLTKQKMRYYVEAKHILHADARETNVLFPFDDKTFKLGIPELIDWGEWSELTVWNESSHGKKFVEALDVLERFNKMIDCNKYPRE